MVFKVTLSQLITVAGALNKSYRSQCISTPTRNSKGKVALDNITLWANGCTKFHGNTISRYHLIAQCVSGGEFFHRELYSVTPAAFRHNIFDLQATAVYCAFSK